MARVSDADAIRCVFELVAVEVRRLQAHLPERIKLTRAALDAAERRVANYTRFIGEGKGTRALGEGLRQAEEKVDARRQELDILVSTADAVFQVPPVQWIAECLSDLQKLLERQTARSAPVLRHVVGPGRLVPTTPVVGRPSYSVVPMADPKMPSVNLRPRDVDAARRPASLCLGRGGGWASSACRGSPPSARRARPATGGRCRPGGRRA